ncbi:2-dehydropantoate 2-reductase [Komagataeibacter saccharivorans]|uniref:ketopantoate reductase family protein n=1 Tax=Komagataeibacter saccharivorans TaxID=265959 RepID=UPI000D7BB620|nr:ketopantoate reductase family protein [Komagataeibacter saccharivorans]PYD50903.1 2-dehydropantoate 2-reductase [Komagataeibacter saccharivorans]GBQ40652.1 2-dehydropantoate 2-reductase [Komagataeibacter saccharivorans NRIC 0614]
MKPRILVVGAGAVGGYFGARLAAAGHDVTFLVRPGRLRQIRADGLHLVSAAGNASISPQMMTTDEITHPYDIVLLSVKAYSLAQAMDDFSAAVGVETCIVPLLNGMCHLDVLAERFGADAVLGGTCFIVSTLDADGRIVQTGPQPRLSYGERSGVDTPRVHAISAALSAPGFDTVLSPHIMQDMWDKWVLLASLGTLCCLMRGTVGDVARQPYGQDFARATVAECVAVAGASGHPPADGVVERTIRMLTAESSTLTSSMFRDLSQGAAIEAGQIIGDLVARARSYAVATPILDLVDLNLRVYEGHRADKGR